MRRGPFCRVDISKRRTMKRSLQSFVGSFMFAASASCALADSPLDPGAPFPPLTYRSAFTGYRAYADTELRSWRKVNETVQMVGGHAGAIGSADGSDTRTEPPNAGMRGTTQAPAPVAIPGTKP